VHSICASCFLGDYNTPITETGFTLVETLFDDFQFINFEVNNLDDAPYHTGEVNGQNGWVNLFTFDRVVANRSGLNVPIPGPQPLGTGVQSFGSLFFRLGNAYNGPLLGDILQTATEPLAEDTGEFNATPTRIKPRNFMMQFDIISAKPTYQYGLEMSISPDDGLGDRMSYLRFEDHVDGIYVYFDDVVNTTIRKSAVFNETLLTPVPLNRSKAYNWRLTVFTPDGPSNDIVKVYLNCVLIHVGTSWENYYYYDPEDFNGFHSRIMNTVNMRVGSPNATNAGGGFILDNFLLGSY